MASRIGLVPTFTLAAALLAPAAVQAELYREEIDGILLIQAVGTLPEPEDDDDPDIRTDADIRASCFEDFPDELRLGTRNFEISGNEVWGTGDNDVDRVEIGGRSASDFGFLPEESYDDGDCSDVEDQWDEYDKPDDGQFFFFGDLRVEPGTAGTDVRIDDGFRLTFFPGASITIRGTADEPVEFRGGQWTGIDLNGAQADLEHCELRQTSGGNALRLRSNASAVVSNCLFENNEARSGGAIQLRDNASLDLRDSDFDNNEAAFGGALHAEGGGVDLYLENVRFAGSDAQSRGGALYIDGATADLANISVLDGEAGRGGGVYLANSEGAGAVRMWNPVIAGNTGRTSGGGLRLSDQADVTLFNPTIAYNQSTRGGGIQLGELPSQLEIRNAILDANEIRDADDASGPQIQNDTPGNVSLQRVMMEGGLEEGYGGQLPTTDDVITGDVAFRDTPDGAGEGEGSDFADFRLASESDAINRGDGALFDGADFDDVDRDGNERIFGQQDPEIDLGAYEFPNNPPELLDTDEIELRVDEDDDPQSLQICSAFRDDDIPPDGFDARVVPWLTQAPGDDEELPETDQDDPGGGGDFGDILQDENGRPGDPISADSEIEDPDGRVFFDPANRSASYEVTVQCRVRNELIDLDEDEVDDERSILSRDSQIVRITVDASNDPPTIDGVADEDAEVGRQFETDYRVSDDDADHDPQDLEVNLVEGPEWAEISRAGDDEIRLEGRPPQPGEYELEIEVIDPAGGTAVERFTITVEEAEPLEEVDAGDDKSAEPGERVRLSAEGPDRAGLSFEWRILDRDDNEVASQPGADFTWTAEAGRYTALVELIDGDEVIADDSLSLTVAEGLSGSVDDEPREPPDEEQEAELDGMSEDGDPDNVADWEARDDNEKAAALADTSATDLDGEQASAVADQVDDLLQSAAENPPIDPALADDLAAAQGNLSGVDLDDDQRDQVAAGMEQLRAQARADEALSDAAAANLIRGGSGLLADDDVPPEQRNRILAGLDDDLREAEEAGRVLDDPTTNRALAALENSVGPGEVDGAQIDQILGGVGRAVEANADPSDTQLTMGVRVVGEMLSEREGAGLTSEQRARVKEVGDDLARAAIRGDQPISVTGNRFLNVSARPIAADVTDPILVGNPSGRGPNALFTVAAQNELRQRNGLADDEALGVALVATRRGAEASYVVDVSATDGDAVPLSDTSVEAPVRLRIPMVGQARNEPRNVDGAPLTMSNVDTNDDGVRFDSSGVGRFTLVSGVDPDDERSDSDKASCFLDSLF